MRSAVRNYLAHKSALRRSEHSVAEYRKRLRYFREHVERRGIRAVRELTIEAVREYHDAMIARGLKSSTRSAHVTTLKDFLSWAHERGLMLSDLSARVEVPKPGKKLPPTPLRPEEMERFLALFAPEGQIGKRNRAAMEVLYACGLRRSELVGLNVGDVDFAACTVFVRGKGGKERLVPVHDTALKFLADYLGTRGGKLAKAEPLFVVHYRKDTQGKRMTENDLASLFRSVRKRFPKHVHPHLLRHTFACHLLQGGADLRYVQALLGHEFPDTTSKYLGLVKEDIKRAYDLAMEGILDPGQELDPADDERRIVAGGQTLTVAPQRTAVRFGRAVECWA